LLWQAPVETTLSARKWDFRGTSISDFFNNIRRSQPSAVRKHRSFPDGVTSGLAAPKPPSEPGTVPQVFGTAAKVSVTAAETASK
jgi:hypothetical protein